MQRYPDKLVTLPQQIGNVTYILDVTNILANCYRIVRYRQNILKLQFFLFIITLRAVKLLINNCFQYFWCYQYFGYQFKNIRHRHRNIRHKNKGNVTYVSRVTIILGDRPKNIGRRHRNNGNSGVSNILGFPLSGEVNLLNNFKIMPKISQCYH